MNTNRKAFNVRHGQTVLRIVPCAKGWRFDLGAGKDRRQVTAKRRKDIVAKAEDALEQMPTGFSWAQLPASRQRFLQAIHAEVRTPDEERALLDYLKGRQHSETIDSATVRFVDHQEIEAGGRTHHVRDLDFTAKRLREAFGAKMVSEVSAADLAGFLKTATQGRSAKRQQALRSNLVQFWKWAQREGIAGNSPTTPAERLPRVKVGKSEKRIFQPAELVAILNEVEEEFRAWVVLSAFAGIRPEEIAPGWAARQRPGKRGLHIEEIDWDFAVIRIPEEVSKVETVRIVPMLPILKEALAWSGLEQGQTGPVVLRDPVKVGESVRLGNVALGGKWPADALRHSFGSYRNGQLRNLPQVAEEMGNSVSTLQRYYHNPRTAEEAKEWFGLRLEVPTWLTTDQKTAGVWTLPEKEEREEKRA